MIMVILNWLYIGITSFLTGFAILSLFARLFTYEIRHTISIFLAGLITVTVYAQIFSLFTGVGMWANVILCVICLLILAIYRKELISWTEKKGQTIGKIQPIVVFLLFFLFAYGTSRGYLHFDTGLYHAQSIRWIETYGVVPGLANLQARFAYNSAAFPLTALYSWEFLIGQSLHTTAGFFAFLSACLTLDIYHVFTDRKIRLSDFVRMGLIFYLSIIYSQMVSPASDYYAQLLIFDSILLWLDTTETFEKQGKKYQIAPYALICILLVYAVTIKFSVGLMLLLVILPAVLLIQEKAWKKIIICIASGIGVLAPFLIRNVIISGWLIYPSAIIDLFNVDWKVPKGQVQYDAMEIGAYGKGITDVTKADTPFKEWIVPWFEGMKGLEKALVLGTILALICGIIYLLIRWISYGMQRKQHIGSKASPDHTKPDIYFTLVFAVLGISAIFWFVSAPLVRYGYAYVVLVPLLTFGHFYLLLYEKATAHSVESGTHTFGITFVKCMRIAVPVIVVVFVAWRAKGIVSDIMRTCQQEYYVNQLDYGDGEATTYEVDGITIYVPTYQGQIGYYKFPSSPLIQNIELRGSSLEQGFRQKQ